MDKLELHPTRCAICATEGNSLELYPANFELDALNPVIFSARRLPDGIHYRIVRCSTCGLVRSDPVAPSDLISALYKESSFDYSEEVENIRRTYGGYLAKLDLFGGEKGSILEVGCGNGFFLEQALRQGYKEAHGVEPSESAVAGADPKMAPNIVCDIMHKGIFPERSMDAICLFQVLDHIPGPTEMLKECFQVLKPGGLILCLNHNVDSISARLLKARSPIIDIEHTYLYGPATIKRLFEHCGFQTLKLGPVFNRYSIHYLARLVPAPRGVKKILLKTLLGTRLGRISLSVPLGNLFLIARRPAEDPV